MTTQGSTLAFRNTTSGALGHAKSERKQVHVQMDTFTTSETTAQDTPSEGDIREYDSAGNVVTEKDKIVDIEAQLIREDFRRPPY